MSLSILRQLSHECSQNAPFYQRSFTSQFAPTRQYADCECAHCVQARLRSHELDDLVIGGIFGTQYRSRAAVAAGQFLLLV